MEHNTEKKLNAQPNFLLRRQRKLRNWTLNGVANELDRLCEDGEGSERGIINANMVGSWERGKHVPSLFWRRKLCELYSMSADDLGLIEPLPPQERPSPVVSSSEQFVSPVFFRPIHQAIAFLSEAPEATTEQQLGAWLAVVATDLAPLFELNWSLEDVLTSLQVLLKGVQAMSKFTRRELLQLGAGALIRRVPILEGKHVSAEDRAELQNALGESIAAGWKLFHTAGNAQVLAVGQALLYLVQQNHALLSSRERSKFYSSVYNLIGSALLFQGRYEDAIDAHINAHIAALGSGDAWEVTQSLICQANGYESLRQYHNAFQALEEALHTIGNPIDETRLRSKAHLLACWADNAIMAGEKTIAEEKLHASAEYLEQISPNEQFDRASWLQLAGKYAFRFGDFTKSIQHYEKALTELPSNWIVRQAIILNPLIAAYVQARNQEASIATARKAASALYVLNAPIMNKNFIDSIQGLLVAFPSDQQVSSFVADTLHQLS